MKTHGHGKGNITHSDLSADAGAKGEMASGEIPNVDSRLMGAANYHGTCIPM